MAVVPRGPDIIQRTSIPLSATSDQPLDTVVRPPESASNHADDLAAGTPKEISAEELALAEAARRPTGVTNDADPAQGPKPETTAKPDKDAEPPKLEFDPLPENLPGYAIREITKHRKQAQVKADAAWKAAQAAVGDDAWNQAMTVARDAQVETAKKEAKIAADEKAAALDRATALEKELADLKAKAETPKEDKPAEDPRPARDKFDDPDEYDAALEAWGVREGERKAQAKLDEERATAETARKAEEDEAQRQKDTEAQTAREAEIAKINESWQAKRTAAIEKYEDYQVVAEADPNDGGPVISEAMAAAILHSDNGTDIAYYLGQNTEEALRIASLTNPVQHFIEIGRLAERLATPARRAPVRRPIEPIDSASNRADTSNDEPDMDAYYARRSAELNKQRHPFFPQGGIH